MLSYPGLMCDVESYIYLPKLENTGYIPKQKYTSGEEIREYAQLLATQFRLDARAMFQSSVQSCTWDPMKQEWASQICVRPKRGAQGTVDIRSDFVLFATGLLSNIKLPDLPGMGLYQGRTFHSGRWDYNFTGGSQENPVMTGLQDKTVALVGTGATGVQILPHAAQYAGQLFVVQRTPSSVDVRDNKDTDLSEWHADIAIENGWQRMRADNFEDHLNNTQPPPKVDLVDDYLTKMLTFSAAVGTPMQIGAHNMTDYVNYLHALDFPRQERIRKRVKDTVQDPITAQVSI
jgi:cation diffusion facilitator CzcD-associated flavoprotein CzcO